MKFSDVVKNIISSCFQPMTPQEIRDQIKMKYPNFYGTTSHLRNVKKGYYKDIDHAILAQIYTLIRTNNSFICDKSTKPMKVSLIDFHIPLHGLSKSAIVKKRSSERKGEYKKKVKEILENADKYHEAYYEAKTFSGPSLYFHHRALATRCPPTSFIHLEYVYATLVSWGMHKMGKGGSKMCDFETFSQSIQPIKHLIVEAQSFDFHNMNDEKWSVLKQIFQGIKVMESRTTLIGNSKAMHHMLPNIIPPIDRQYTLRFLYGNATIRNNLEHEWFLMKEIISQFFIPIASDRKFYLKAEEWMKRKDKYPWDTSVFKVIDNLVIGSTK